MIVYEERQVDMKRAGLGSEVGAVFHDVQGEENRCGLTDNI